MPPTRRAQQPLSRDRILDVALAIASADGLVALSMRRIATELGTGPMSLYNHVPDKDALLGGLAERVLADVEVVTGGDWRETGAAWATSLRRAILAHRPLVPVIVSPQYPEPMAAAVGALTTALTDGGLAPADAAAVTAVLGRYVAGSAMLDAAAGRRRGATGDELDRIFQVGLAALLDGLPSHLG
jgi:AcrR family transcriptional regulator